MTLHASIPAPAFLSTEEAAAVRLPLEAASFLPPRVYSDPAIFEAEWAGMFRSSWVPLCHVSQLREPGSYVARNLFGEPVIAVRNKAGAVHVMSNVCRHRNALLAQGSGQCRGSRLTCPYHGWTYGLDGQLLAAPHMEQASDFARKDVKLPEVRHEIWQGFVFVNLDGSAPPLGAQLASLTPKVKPWRWEDMRAIEIRRARVPWNWKVSLENFSEAYHQPFIHPETADRDYPAKTAIYEDSDGPYSVFWIPDRDGRQIPSVVPPIEGMPQDYYTSLGVVNVYPFLHIFTDAATPLWLDWEIHGVDDHEMVWYVMVLEETLKTHDVDKVVADFMAFIEPILLEDVDVCRSVGMGVHSHSAVPGRLSHMEKAVHQFQNWWVDNFRI